MPKTDASCVIQNWLRTPCVAVVPQPPAQRSRRRQQPRGLRARQPAPLPDEEPAGRQTPARGAQRWGCCCGQRKRVSSEQGAAELQRWQRHRGSFWSPGSELCNSTMTQARSSLVSRNSPDPRYPGWGLAACLT